MVKVVIGLVALFIPMVIIALIDKAFNKSEQQ